MGTGKLATGLLNSVGSWLLPGGQEYLLWGTFPPMSGTHRELETSGTGGKNDLLRMARLF